jgi:hypothetical protein
MTSRKMTLRMERTACGKHTIVRVAGHDENSENIRKKGEGDIIRT